MQYVKTEAGFEKLPKPNVDFGGGLERLSAAALSNPDVFMTDLFVQTRTCIEKLSQRVYGVDEADTRAFRIVMDHARVSAFLLADGVLPSNTDRGYILRRVIRRMVRFADMLSLPAGSLATLIETVITTYADIYPNLSDKHTHIVAEAAKEETKFRHTLTKGLKELERRIALAPLTGRDAFDLFTTYGFPFEMTCELASEQGIVVDETEFRAEFEKHRELSRTASAGKFKGGLADHSEQVVRYHTATHLLQQALRTVLGTHVAQQGSNLTAERLRFDFTHPTKMTDEEKQQVEAIVNEQISAALPVTYQDLPLEEAKKLGAIGLFEEKYGDRVRVYRIGDFSLEFCGGPHVINTSELGHFRIAKEEASSAGIRRIKAVLE
jgi:alanyl-tRNA synthetase